MSHLKTNKRRTFVAAAAVVCVAGVVAAAVLMYLRLPSAASSLVKAQALAPARGEATGGTVVLASPGRVEGLSEAVEVGAGADGVLTRVLVREGQHVAAGQTVATVSCADLAGEVEVARAAVAVGEEAKARLLRGSRAEERRRVAAETSAAEASLRQTKLQYDRVVSLVESGDVAREEYDRARRDLDVAQAARSAARARELLANAPPLPEEVGRADAEIRAARGKVRAGAERLEKCDIKSPITGTVLRAHMKAGETVSTVYPRPVVTVADTSRLRVRAEVDERDIGRVREGQKVLVLVDAYPGNRLAGRVASLGEVMGLKRVRTGDPAEKSDRDVLEVMVDLGGYEGRLVVGLRVTVQFLSE